MAANFLLAPLAVFLLLVGSSSARFAIKVPQSEIKTICSETTNPGFCETFFKSKPGAAKADLRGLAKLTVESARQSASRTLKEIHSLVKKATDPKSKEVYSSCSENYDSVASDLADALKALAAGDAGTLNINVSAAVTDADTCKDDLASVSPHPSSIMKEIEDLENVSSIALVISNMLHK